jgi:anti-sigma factor RsiW
MTDPQCQRLDEYLCGWLSTDEAADFEAHLAGCPACQEESAVQRRIDRLLAERAAQAETVPAVLASRVERGIRAARRRRLFGWADALTAAAAVVLAVGLWGAPVLFSTRGNDRPIVENPTVPVRATEPLTPPAFAGTQPVVARVTLLDSSSAILVPVESHSPNVTVVCVYPTLKVARDAEKRPSP